MKKIDFEIEQDFGTIGTKRNRKGQDCDVKLCAVAWHGRKATYDIRMFTADGDTDKGISLSKEMLKSLRGILDSMDL